MTPKVKLEVNKQNVGFKATKVWNKLIGNTLERNEFANSVMSDLSASKE